MNKKEIIDANMKQVAEQLQIRQKRQHNERFPLRAKMELSKPVKARPSGFPAIHKSRYKLNV